MPFALLIIGLFLLIAGVRNTQDQLFTLIHGDFTGADNFIFWLLSILVIGSIGYVQKLKPVSTGFLVLIVLVLFLRKGNSSGIGGGFFSQFTSAIAGSTSGGTGTTLSQMAANQQTNTDTLRNAIAQNIAATDALTRLR